MRKLLLISLAAAAAVVFGACEPGAGNRTTVNSTTGNSNANTAKPAAAAPTAAALLALDTKAFEAWKNKDGKFFEDFLTPAFVSFGKNGRMDKAGEIKAIAESKCTVNSYTLSDEQMTSAGPDAAVLTFKATTDVLCDGKKQPSPVIASTVYVRSGELWKAAYHNEVPLIDPKDWKAAAPKPAPPAGKPAAAAETKPADATTEALLAVEKKGWEAWKNRDTKGLEAVLAKNVVVVDAIGNRFDNAGAIKIWTDEPNCEIKSFTLTDSAGVALTKDVGLLTSKGTADGKCYGQAVPPIWGTSVFVKDGENWKYVMIFNTPA